MTLPQPTQLPATLTFEQLRDGIRRCHERILAIEVEYETTAEVVRAEPQLGEIVPRSRHRFAFKGEKRFAAQSSVPEPGFDGPLELDFIQAFDGKVAQSYHRSAKEASIDHRKKRSIRSGRYVDSLPIFVPDDCGCLPCGGSDPHSLPFALDRAELGWSVQPTLDVMDGKACHVLKANRGQRFWIDPDTNYALRFEETRMAIVDARPVDEWPLLNRVALRDYRPIAGDISLPWRVEVVRFISARMPESDWNQPSVLSVDEVIYLAVNDGVSDECFTLSFPPGTRVTDKVNQRYYRVGRNNVDINLAGPEWYLALGRRQKN